MKKQLIIFLFSLSLLLLNCTPEKFSKVHTLKTKEGQIIGDVYVKFINDSIFTDLFVIYQSDTLYSIKRTNFYSKKNKEINVYPTGFYGYKFILKKDDYIVLSYLRESGKKVSDDITIEWNYDSKGIELLLVP